MMFVKHCLSNMSLTECILDQTVIFVGLNRQLWKQKSHCHHYHSSFAALKKTPLMSLIYHKLPRSNQFTFIIYQIYLLKP